MSSSSSQPFPIQPDHFYGQAAPAVQSPGRNHLHPDDDPFAARGIPVFKPSMEEFLDFEQYMNKIECWGMKSGIVKIVPPKAWRDALPSTVPQLAHIKLRNPIEQEFIGGGGIFRQQNMEKRRIMSVREWAELCAKEDLRSPSKYEVEQGRRYVSLPSSSRSSRRSTRMANTEDLLKAEIEDVNMANARDDQVYDEELSDHAKCTDPASSLPTPPHVPQSPTAHNPSALEDTTNSSSIHTSSNRRSAAERQKAKETLDAAFLATFNPHEAWLPKGISPEDYTPEFCKALERMYWRSCGLGRAPWYGADMKGSLFTDETKHWNVANLPSVLSRLLGPNSQISGVNTPYLYFGMWRATFAWHVEDMDLFSINYIHFGSPKHWYAIPQARAQALEATMKGHFPLDTSSCPQFLRHKSYLASPNLLAKSSIRPNVLVQHAGEFVVTFPRGYHAGFNLGFNCAESTNFALDSWIELGLKAAFCSCVNDSVRIDVKGLIEAKQQREREGCQKPKEDTSKKRRVEAVITDTKSKRSKVAPASPESIPEPVASKSKVNKSRTATNSNTALDVDKTVFPCCLCVSMDANGLLPVNDPPSSSSGLARPPDGIWRAHETCARVIPETWVDEVTAGEQSTPKVVWGVDGIVKDRWMLKCAACTRPKYKLHGAPIQCTKGKCSKAFHVSCAMSNHANTSYRVVEETEKEVVLLEPETPGMAAESSYQDQGGVVALDNDSGPKVLKTIKKFVVEVLCSQHNPSMIAKRKANKDDRLKAEVMALKEMDRVKIRNSSGVFEVSLVKVYVDRGTVEVLWDGGVKREFRWGSIVWSNDAQTTGKKPTIEEMKKNPPLPPVFPTSHSTNSRIVGPVGASFVATATTSLPTSVSTLQPSMFKPPVSPATSHSDHSKSFLRLTPYHIQKPGVPARTPPIQDATPQPPSSAGHYPYGYPLYPYHYPYSYTQYQPYGAGMSQYSVTQPTGSATNGPNSATPAAAVHGQASPKSTSIGCLSTSSVAEPPIIATTSSLPVQNGSTSAPNVASSSVPSTQQAWPYSYYNSTSPSSSSPANHYLHLPPNMHAYYQQHYARLLSGNAGVASAVTSAMNAKPKSSPQPASQSGQQSSSSSSTMSTSTTPPTNEAQPS